MSATIEKRIEELRTRIANIKATNSIRGTQKAQFEAAAKRLCNQTLKSKRQECEGNNAYNLSRAKALDDEIKVNLATINNLESEIAGLNQQIQKEAEAVVVLAQQGRTPASVQAEATAQAAAAKQVADAQAAAIAQSADAEAKAKSTKNVIAIIAALVVLVVVAILVKRKFMK